MNNKVFAIGINVNKIETSPLGINLVINDIDNSITEKLIEFSEFENNIEL